MTNTGKLPELDRPGETIDQVIKRRYACRRFSEQAVPKVLVEEYWTSLAMLQAQQTSNHGAFMS